MRILGGLHQTLDMMWGHWNLFLLWLMKMCYIFYHYNSIWKLLKSLVFKKYCKSIELSSFSKKRYLNFHAKIKTWIYKVIKVSSTNIKKMLYLVWKFKWDILEVFKHCFWVWLEHHIPNSIKPTITINSDSIQALCAYFFRLVHTLLNKISVI